MKIWSLRHPSDARTHPLHDRLHARVRYLPEYLRDDPVRVARGMGAAADLPGFDAAAEGFSRRRRARRYREPPTSLGTGLRDGA